MIRRSQVLNRHYQWFVRGVQSMRIGIIGAGHAGVEAAQQASRLGARVVLFSGESVHPYFRPRVIALAFGRTELDAIYLKSPRWYGEHEIDLRLKSPVVQLNVQAKSVTAGGRQESFDALILATGAAPVLLPFVLEFPGDVLPLWAVPQSLLIRERLRGVQDLVILGGGISGIESALYAREAGLQVTVVEKTDRLMALQFGIRATVVLGHRLREKGIRLLTGRCAAGVVKQRGRLKVVLDDGKDLPCDLVLTTVGTTRTLELFQHAGIETDRGIVVDERLQTSVPGVFACGDIAQRDNVRTATVARAGQQGRGAADNAVAFLQGRPLNVVPEPVAALSFMHSDTEFHSIGSPAGHDLQERVLSDDGRSVYRSVLLENSLLRGVQMIGSHDGLRQLADSLGRFCPIM
jgi:NAD(P)H-nitrite reductase large subunit